MTRLVAALLLACGGSDYVPVGERISTTPDEWCDCFSSLVTTGDGGVCHQPSAGCRYVCTCTTAPLCAYDYRPYECVGGTEDGDAG